MTSTPFFFAGFADIQSSIDTRIVIENGVHPTLENLSRATVADKQSPLIKMEI
jgi:hypothetical protein